MQEIEEVNNSLEQRSLENLIITYRPELLRIVAGEFCSSILPRSVRRQLNRKGILAKVGQKSEVTPKGEEMLSVIHDE